MFNHDKKKRYGSAPEHGAAHQQDHRKWSRRTFLKNLGLATGGATMLGGMPVKALGLSPLTALLNGGIEERALVIIRLAGGNDGLNTIVPLYDYGTYINHRPTLAIPQNQLLYLNDSFGMPQFMQELNPLWQEGQMKVIHGVGYPEQNLSHFRSSDIWDSASDSNVVENSGWLGRYILNQFPDFFTEPPSVPPAIQIGNYGSILFHDEAGNSLAYSVTEPEELEQLAQIGELYDTTNLPDCYFGEQLGFVRSITNSTFRYAESIVEAYQQSANTVEYSGDLGYQLSLVARMVKGNLGTKLYLVSIDGFDTHAEQEDMHTMLMSEVASQVKAFFDDLSAGGRAQDVLCMTVSEFGRRLDENASGGTDHGAAAPILLFGPGLNGNGFVGAHPNLDNLDAAGNLIFTTDFRQVYASLLENWLCLDPVEVDEVLGGSYNRLSLGLDCIATSASGPAPGSRLQAEIRRQDDGSIAIQYYLPEAGNAQLLIIDMMGRPVETLASGYQLFGTHQVIFRPSRRLPASGMYIAHLRMGNQAVSEKFTIIR
ncbi:MAG: DUF1501 domain-containing protein [Phaeodactylibacter sp.]|nr:DUF1501 domain-containing protein [Phaeodactylibacter sp.]MCB9267304.1 DUF1501 domain-containing protein [Lewinellaceae bacterium]